MIDLFGRSTAELKTIVHFTCIWCDVIHPTDNLWFLEAQRHRPHSEESMLALGEMDPRILPKVRVITCQVDVFSCLNDHSVTLLDS